MNKTTLGILITVIVLGGGALFFLRKPQEPVSKKMAASPVVQVTPSPAELEMTEETPAPATDSLTSSPSPANDKMEKIPTGNVKTFTVTGENFSFDLKTIAVKKGDTVKITFKNAEGFHDWVIDEFNAKTKKLQGGQEETIQFVADKTGSFEYYCSVGEHRKMGMKGTLTVQ